MDFKTQAHRALDKEKRIGQKMGLIESWTKQDNVDYYRDVWDYYGDFKFGQIAWRPDWMAFAKRNKSKGERFHFVEEDFAQGAYSHGIEFFGYPRDSDEQCTKEMLDAGECPLKYIPIDVDSGAALSPEVGLEVTRVMYGLLLDKYQKEPIISLGRKGRFHVYIPLTQSEVSRTSKDGICRMEICELADELNDLFPDVEITCKTSGKGYSKNERDDKLTVDPTSCDRDHFISLPYSLMIDGGKMYSRIPVTFSELFDNNMEELWEMSRDFTLDDDYRKERLDEFGKLKLS